MMWGLGCRTNRSHWESCKHISGCKERRWPLLNTSMASDEALRVRERSNRQFSSISCREQLESSVTSAGGEMLSEAEARADLDRERSCEVDPQGARLEGPPLEEPPPGEGLLLRRSPLGSSLLNTAWCQKSETRAHDLDQRVGRGMPYQWLRSRRLGCGVRIFSIHGDEFER